MRYVPQKSAKAEAGKVSPSDKERSRLEKLLSGMMLFGAASALTILVFYLLWYWQGDAAVPQDSYRSTSERIKPEIHKRQSPSSNAPNRSKRGDITPEEAALSKKVQILLQGPDAGELVSPPTRNVTPGYQLSPFHQAAPLVREQGSPLPPPPEPEPLPAIFRKLMVSGPSELTLLVTKYRKVTVKLAHIKGPDATRTCWQGAREAKCSALAATALKRFIRRRAVACDFIDATGNLISSDDIVSSGTAQCYLGSGIMKRKPGQTSGKVTDLASWLVRFGWAEADEGYYQDERFEAKEAKRGLFATEKSASGGDAAARQAESRAVSKLVEEQAAKIAPPQKTLAETPSGELSLMGPPRKIQKKEELPLPPGFEWR